MRFTFTLVLCLLLGTSAWAQINSDSPFPAEVVITAPAPIAGSYPYGAQTSNDVNPDNWGPTLTEDLSGEVVWAYDAPGGTADSLCCEMVVTDLTGKIALIRRGECDFSAKVYNAQQAGAIGAIITNHFDNPDDGPETLVGMLGGDNADLVTIPAVFVSRNTGSLIDEQLAAGETVSVTFDVTSFYNPLTVWSYHTPVTDFVPFPGIRINYVNPSADDEVEVTVTATITAPSGAQTVLTGSDIVAPLADSVIILDGEFIPDEIGEHTITFTHDQDANEIFETNFVATEYTYALDSNDETQFGVGPTDEDFANALRYDAGALIVTDDDGGLARYASFGLGNAAELIAAARGDELPPILITLYDADATNDGQLDFSDPNVGANSDFTELSAIAFGEYTITGEEGENEMIYVELRDLLTDESPIPLEANEFYYLVISYDDTFTGIGVAPTYTSSAAVNYPFFQLAAGGALPVTPIITSQFFNGGWNGRTVALRLHLDGFMPVTSTEDLTILDQDRVSIMPNPVGDQLNLQFDLEGLAGETQVGIFGADGRQYGLHSFEAIANTPVQIDVKNLAAGTYFLSILTPEGYRMEKFIKL